MDEREVKKLISQSLGNYILRDFEFNPETLESKFIYKNNRFSVKFSQKGDNLQTDFVHGFYSDESADLIKICITQQIEINLLESELLKYKKERRSIF